MSFILGKCHKAEAIYASSLSGSALDSNVAPRATVVVHKAALLRDLQRPLGKFPTLTHFKAAAPVLCAIQES
eukprot:2531386-Amphidinium_carterae.1